MQRRILYHVVCRECETELLVESEREARDIVDEHAADASHRIAFSRIE